MIILGHKLIPYSLIYEVSSLEELQNSDFTKDFLFEFNEELLEFSLKNKLSFSLYIKSVKEAIIGNNLNAKFLIVQDLIATKIQKIAEYYLFDSKIALLAKDDSAIENAAQEGIDALILPPAIIKKEASVRRIVVYSAIFALIYLVLDFSYLIFIKKLPFLSALNENLPLQISMVIIFLITGFILEKSSNTDVKTEKKEESYISLQKAIISSIFSPISLDLKSQNLLQEVANTLSLEFATLLNYKKDEIINIAEISPNEHFSVSKNISLKQQGSSQLERMILDFHASSEEFSIKNFNEYSVVFSSLKPSYLTKEIGCLVLVFKKDIEIDDKIKEFIDFLSQNIEFSLSLWLKKEELSQVSSSSPVSISLPNGIEPYAKMEEVLTFETRRYKRYGAPLALLLFSVDHFENLSNIFGKEKGDLLLKEILLLVKNATRTTDIVAHWKDGIFAIVMPQNSFGDASALANKLRGLIAKRHFSNLGKVTCSFGASMLESQKDSSDLLKQRALDALNKAKSLGGDRAEIVLYSTEFESLSIR